MRRRNREGAGTPSEGSRAPVACALCGEGAERSYCWDCAKRLCAACRIAEPVGAGWTLWTCSACMARHGTWPLHARRIVAEHALRDGVLCAAQEPPVRWWRRFGATGLVASETVDGNRRRWVPCRITVLRHDGDPMRLKFGG